jgi:hypothetical protein
MLSHDATAASRFSQRSSMAFSNVNIRTTNHENKRTLTTQDLYEEQSILKPPRDFRRVGSGSVDLLRRSR